MDGEIFVLVLLILLLLSGSLLGWVNFFTIRALKRQVSALHQVAPAESEAPSQATEYPLHLDLDLPPETAPPAENASPAHHSASVDPGPDAPEAETPPRKPDPTPAWLKHLKKNWMVWLGGLSIGLAGVFLAAYSIEQNYLGPQARVTLGLLTGFALHGAAEYLRRRMPQRHEITAALAGGASVTLYAALLASVHLYALWPPALVFALLALVSLGTMLLARWYGPMLAVFGLAGAYAVPLLIGGEGEHTPLLLVYNLIIASTGLFLLRYVYRTWLLALNLGGALLWWFLVLSLGGADEWLGLYLTLLAYAVLAVPEGDYLLQQEHREGCLRHALADFLQFDTQRHRDLFFAVLSVLMAHSASLMWYPQWSISLLLWTPFLALVLVAARTDEALKLLPVAAAVLTALAVLGAHLEWRGLLPEWPLVLAGNTRPVLLAWFLSVVAALFSLGAYWHSRDTRYPALAVGLGTLAPLGALALLWVLTTGWLSSLYWGGVSLALGVVYVSRARLRWRTQADTVVVWLFIAGHVAYSLAAVILFSQATLTLALTAQVVSLAWLWQRFTSPLLDRLIRLVLIIVIFRLTLNPWLLGYGAATGWSFWTYGGALACVGVARWLVRNEAAVKLWLEGALLHLLVLFVATSLRYWLYDGSVFAGRYGFTEAALNTSVWAGLGLVYYYRSQVARHTALLCRVAAALLMSAAVLNFGLVLTQFNPLWNPGVDLAPTPLFNGLALAYGLPVLLFALAAMGYEPLARRYFALLSGIALWLLVSFEVRHLWHGRLWASDPILSGELYSYSISWLLLAAAAMLAGHWRRQDDIYKGGLTLLVIVVAKVFLVDLSDLAGLWRVLTFMGLGLCLLALAYLHQTRGHQNRGQMRPPGAAAG